MSDRRAKQIRYILPLLLFVLVFISCQSRDLLANPILVIGENDDFVDSKLIQLSGENPLLVFSQGQEKSSLAAFDKFEDIVFVDALPRDFAVPAVAMPVNLIEYECLPKYVVQKWQVYLPETKNCEIYIVAADVLPLGQKIVASIDGTYVFSKKIDNGFIQQGRLILLSDGLLSKGNHRIEVTLFFAKALKADHTDIMPARIFAADSSQRIIIQDTLERRMGQPQVNVHYIFNSNNSFYFP